MQSGPDSIPPLAVIIVGAPRSGTYWLVDLLQTRLGIYLPTETHFFPLFRKYLWLWGDLSCPRNRRRLLYNIYEFVAAWTVRSSVSEEYRAGVRRLSLLVTIDEGRADNIVAESWDYESLVEALYRHFADIQGARASGDKSAHYRVIDPEKLFSPFPETRMLHVIRDGRDVALSWLKEWFGPPDVREAARKWVEHVEVNRAWGQENPERYLEVRYEDLADDLEREITKLEAFFGIEAAPLTGQSSTLAEVLSASPSHAGMKKIVASDNVAKWRVLMSDQDVSVFESVASQTLLSCGYEEVNSSHDQVIAAGGGSSFSMHSLRVLAKSLLPIFLYLGSRLRIPVLALVNRRYSQEWRKVSL